MIAQGLNRSSRRAATRWQVVAPVFLVAVSFAGLTSAFSAPAAPDVAPDLKAAYARPASVPFPDENRFTHERETLGKTLFFDPRLSGSGWISCASCHNPGFSWEDHLPVALGNGMKPLSRRTPTLANLAWGERFFWDGRAASLEQQALGPIQSSTEMGADLSKVIERVSAIAGYQQLFAKAYPGEAINEESIGKALATFERTIVSGQSRFDRWIAGDAAALSEPAERGFILFNGKAKCAQCHSGWRFTDDSFHDVGVSGNDLGRGAILRKIPAVQYAFKTPTLRNVAKRGPYMHNGSEVTLAGVIDLYDAGGREKRPTLDNQIQPLHLCAQDKADLLAFLESLNSDDDAVTLPALP